VNDGGSLTTSERGSAAAVELRDRYLDLLERALTHTLYQGVDAGEYVPGGRVRRWIHNFLHRRGFVRVSRREDLEGRRAEGKDWPLYAQTMVGLKRLHSLRTCVEAVIRDGVRGDLIETGVWRGGSSILMRGILDAHGELERTVYAADSFQGLPRADTSKYPQDAGVPWDEIQNLVVTLDEVKDNFRRYGLLQGVEFVQGWFKDTLPALRDKSWAVIRLDGDLYESTMDALTNLYDGLSPGGFLIVDDYSIPACRSAVDDFRGQRRISEPLTEIDWSGVYWRRAS
jgi:O-methyltransferase